MSNYWWGGIHYQLGLLRLLVKYLKSGCDSLVLLMSSLACSLYGFFFFWDIFFHFFPSTTEMSLLSFFGYISWKSLRFCLLNKKKAFIGLLTWLTCVLVLPFCKGLVEISSSSSDPWLFISEMGDAKLAGAFSSIVSSGDVLRRLLDSSEIKAASFCWKVNTVTEYAGFILEIGQWGPPSLILGGPFSRKGAEERGPPKVINLFVQSSQFRENGVLSNGNVTLIKTSHLQTYK